MDSLRKALDLSPNNRQARSLMAEANMELWRLAVNEQNTELANVTRREVESFAPNQAVYSAELNGFGSLIASFDAPDAESYLFRFETLNIPPAKDREPQPARLIPVPYDLKERHSDTKFLEQEQARVAAGKPVPVDKHSIFNLEPTPVSKAGSGGKVIVPELPPGNYMLLVRAPGRIEVRISLRMERLGRIKQDYILPKTEQNPPGFFYMAGGDFIAGGETAGAPAPHSMKTPPAWIYHDEISMGEYAAFLQWLVKNGRNDEARQGLPKDFGKNLAILSPNGQLLAAEGGIDPAAFAKSPVRGVSFNDAKAYVAWRGKQEGLPYRLPQDWEWEAACRGADGRKYSWGDSPGKGLAVVTQGYGDTGGNMSWKWEDYKDESPWGIHNLAGGAAEWTGSLYDPNAKAQDPVFGQAAIRGNAWALPPVGLECAFRTSGQPDYFHPTIGFRMALDHPYTRTAPAAPADSSAVHQH
jgi:formylglycine-generating enzyme required for sulfatase activity